MPVTEDQAAALAGGVLFSGMTFVISTQVLYSHGLQFDLFHDKKRQTILNLLCFICAIAGIVRFPLNATEASVWASNILNILMFALVQFGLGMLNHNTFARINALDIKYFSVSKENFQRLSLIFYILPFVCLVPIYLAAIEKMPGGYLNKSSYNSLVYKPMNVALVLATEVLATVTDIFLILKVIHTNDSVKQEGQRKINMNAPRDLIANYAISWFLICADIFVKAMNVSGKPWLFDSIISMMTIAMRAKCNLEFGLHLKHILSTNLKSTGTGEKSSKFPQSASVGKLASVPDITSAKHVE